MPHTERKDSRAKSSPQPPIDPPPPSLPLPSPSDPPCADCWCGVQLWIRVVTSCCASVMERSRQCWALDSTTELRRSTSKWPYRTSRSHPTGHHHITPPPSPLTHLPPSVAPVLSGEKAEKALASTPAVDLSLPKDGKIHINVNLGNKEKKKEKKTDGGLSAGMSGLKLAPPPAGGAGGGEKKKEKKESKKEENGGGPPAATPDDWVTF